jgi:hypothetical protein
VTSRVDLPTWFERACGGAAFVVPFAVALAHVGSASVWRDDLALLRGVAWVGHDRTGGLSAILTQASFWVPLGSVTFRAGFAAALALAAAGYLIFLVARGVLHDGADTPRLSAALAAIAALTATLGSTGQREGTVAGGGSVALATAALLLAVRPDRALSNPRGALTVGLLFGALAAESGVVALALAAGLGVALAVLRKSVRRREALLALAGAGASALFVLAPLYVRPFAAGPFLDLGRSLAAMGPVPFEAPGRSFGGAGALRDEVGKIALAVAVAGGAVGLVRERLRAAVVPLVVVVLLDVAASLREGSIISSEELAPLHLVALAFLCVGIALAVQTVSVTLLDMQLVMAKQTTLLLVMGDLALAAASAEEASFAADRSVARGAPAFTDEAVERALPGAAVLVRSRAVAQRLWAARVAEGARPDILVVPVPILGDKRIALGLLRAEPALQQTMRDVSLEGRPGEEALTILADARPSMVELDPRWDRRAVSHLVADHFWLRFAPEPLGPSDRKAAFADLRTRFMRVLSAATVDDRSDTSTAAVLRARLADAAAQAAILGDRDEAIALLEQLGKVSSADPFVVELTRRLAASKSGPIDSKGLLR